MSDNIKRGDLFTLTKKLSWDDGTPIDLTDASDVFFIMRLDGATEPTVNDQCVIDEPSTGTVSYTFKYGDTATGGMYRYEFEIRGITQGEEPYRPVTVPSRGKYWIHIEEDLA